MCLPCGKMICEYIFLIMQKEKESAPVVMIFDKGLLARNEYLVFVEDEDLNMNKIQGG